MKKIILIVSFLLCLPFMHISAQAPYKTSVGGMISPVFSAGVSSKTFFADHVAFQVDLMTKGISTWYIRRGEFYMPNAVLDYSGYEQNTNIMYQKKIKDLKKSELFWFCGGGVNIGYVGALHNTFGKLGVNAITGLEFVFNKMPLSIQIDLRPGYGLLYQFPRREGGGAKLRHFDWLVGFSLRYAFKGKALDSVQ